MSTTAYTPQDPMTQNPMLPQHPVTAALDEKYYADEAALRQQIAQKYADTLQQLGYTDNQGNYIPGSVATNAARQTDQLQHGSDQARQGVTDNAQRNGTIFSGRRETDTANAEYPYQQQIAQLGIDTPLQLAQLHEQAGGLVDQYTLQNNQLLADAATRAAGNITQSPTAAPAAGAPPLTGAIGNNAPQVAKNTTNEDPFHSTVAQIHQASLKALQSGPPANQAQVARNTGPGL